MELAQCNGQGLLVQARIDKGADVLEDPLLDLVVVRVDLTRTFGGEDHERVLGGRPLEQLVDRGVGDADRGVVQRGGRCGFGGGHYGFYSGVLPGVGVVDDTLVTLGSPLVAADQQ